MQYTKGTCYCCGKQQLIVDEICDECVKGKKFPINIRFPGREFFGFGKEVANVRIYLNDKYIAKSTTSEGFNLVVPVTAGPKELRLETDLEDQTLLAKFKFNRNENENLLILELWINWANTIKFKEISEEGTRKGINRQETAKKRAENHARLLDFDKAIGFYIALGETEEVERLRKLKADKKRNEHIENAKERERALDYDSAIEIWEELGQIDEAARVRKLKAEQSAIKVDRTVIHGDYVDDRDTTYIDDRDTIVKDSVISKSNIGAGGKTKGERIKLIKELLDSGAIDDDEFKQMKKEILGK